MAMVLEEFTNEEERTVVRFFGGQKDSLQRIFINKFFYVYGG
jgi:hypothetical protein